MLYTMLLNLACMVCICMYNVHVYIVSVLPGILALHTVFGVQVCLY